MSDPYLGEIRLVSFNFAPYGWALCNGQQMNISTNNALFALLGTTYGGNGVSTFNLPDLQGRVPLHAGSGAGLQTYVLGQKSGTENVTLLNSQMPIHTHALNASGATVSIQAGDGAGTVNTPAGNYLTNSGSTDGLGSQVGVNFAPTASAGTLGAIAGATLNLGAGAIATSGGSQPFSILQPYLAVYFIIALQGIFPTRG